MKLAEALVLRADCQRNIARLKQRLERVVKVQEGESPAESPQELLAELERTLDEQTVWIKQINRTNARTMFNERWTLAEALAEREQLMQRRNILTGLIEEASIKQDRFSRSEVKFQRTVDVAQLQTRVDHLAKQYRELDFQIQAMNWSVELTEA